MSEHEYEPFESEWIKEMKKFPKQSLIDIMLKPALIKNIKMLEALKSISEAFNRQDIIVREDSGWEDYEKIEILLKELES